MIEFKIKIKNINKVIEGISRYPETSIKEFNNAIKKSVLSVERNTKREAPVNKNKGGGNLRQSIKSRTKRLYGEVVVNANYGVYVEDGTRPHIIKARNKKVLADRRAGVIFGKKVKHPGTKPTKFFYKGIERSKETIKKFMERAMNVIVSFK